MRIFLVPLIAFAVSPAEQFSEPSESAMRRAFEASLQSQVQNVLEYLQETGGAQAVERVKEVGTDRFEVRSFKKLDCERDANGHVCSFSVDVSVVSGEIAQRVRGHFVSGPDHGLTFVQDI
ncbi:MAG: hypothetical protein ACXWJW_04390 [Xanthobacteraceae bacterium]